MAAPVVSGEAETRVQETADDAALSKISAIRTGYFNDPFMSYFVRKVQRRSPLINRGYFARVAAIDLIVRRFLAVAKRTGDGRCQVVSLGAGMDSTFFRLYADGAAPTTYFEVDFPEVTARKAAIIRRQPLLQKCVAGRPVAREECVSLDTAPPPSSASPHRHGSHHGKDGGGAAASSPAAATSAAAGSDGNPFGIAYVNTASGGCDIRGVGAAAAAAAATTSSTSSGAAPLAGPYRLVTADLRDVAAVQASLVTGAGLDPAVPTLFLSECVLVYLEPEESCAIIAWAARTFPRSVFVTYEQIRPHDAFGQVMARNLEERGYTLRGLHAFPDIPSQTARYRELGYGGCAVADMNDVYYRLLPRGDVARAERLELFDEVEEWHLMSAHYCIAVAVNELPLGALVQHPPPAPAAAAAAAAPHHDARHPSSSAGGDGSAAKRGKKEHHHHGGHHATASSSTSSTPSHGGGLPPMEPHRSRASSGNSMGGVGAGGSSVGGSGSGRPDSPTRVIITDMPAPAPKPKQQATAAAGHPAQAAIGGGGVTAPSSSTVTAAQAAAHATAHASLSPKELAAAVVAAHEAAEAEAAAGRRSLGGASFPTLQRTLSARSSGGSSTSAAGVHGGGGVPGSPSKGDTFRGRSSSSSRNADRSRSRSRSMASMSGGGGGGGGDVDMNTGGSGLVNISQQMAASIAAAVEAASGASVEGIEVVPMSATMTGAPGPMTSLSPMPLSPAAGGGGGTGATRGHASGTPSSFAVSGGGLGGPSPMLRGVSGPGSVVSTAGSSASGSGLVAGSLAVLHTHGGAVHVMAPSSSSAGAAPPTAAAASGAVSSSASSVAGGDGGSSQPPLPVQLPDFAAIAAAEVEMTSARHLREAVGMDFVREVAAAADAAKAAQHHHGDGGGDGGGGGRLSGAPFARSRSSSFASTSSAASAQQPPAHHAPYAPALEGSRAAISIVPTRTHYTPASIAEAGRPVSLLDVLLPLEQWRAPAPGGGGGGGGPAAGRFMT